MDARNLLIAETPLQVLPSLAVAVGLNEAMFLQQLHYMLVNIGHQQADGRRWIHNTHEKWNNQFPFWSVSTIRRIVSNLKSFGVIVTSDEFNKMGVDKTLWYTIDYEAFENLKNPPTTADSSSPCVQSEQTEVSNLNTPITIDTHREDHNSASDQSEDDSADPLEALEQHFVETTGKFPTQFMYAERWREPLQNILKLADGLEEAKTLIDQAWRFALNPGEGKRPYTIANPGSLQNIASTLAQQKSKPTASAAPQSAARRNDDGSYWV